MVSCHVQQSFWYIDLLSLQKLNEWLGQPRIFLLEKCERDSFGPSSACSPDTMNIIGHLLREIVIDHCLNIFDICYILLLINQKIKVLPSPLAATSVATRIFFDPFLNVARVYSLAFWLLSPCIAFALRPWLQRSWLRLSQVLLVLQKIKILSF